MLDKTDFLAGDEVPRAREALMLKEFSRLSNERDSRRVDYPLAEVLLRSWRDAVLPRLCRRSASP